MQVFVTGASGFVGRRVVAHLLRRGHRPICVSRRAAPVSLDKGARWLRADLVDPSAYRDYLHRDVVVVHLASDGPRSLWGRARDAGWARDRRVMAVLAQACRRTGVRKLVYLSAIGASLQSPHAALRCKAHNEEVLRRYGPRDCWNVRASLVFGPEDRFIQVFERWIVRRGIVPTTDAVRLGAQVIFVDDLAEAICNLVEEEPGGFRTLEAGGPDLLDLTDILELAGAARGIPPRRVSLPWAAMKALLFAAAVGRKGLHPLVWPLLETAAPCSPRLFVEEAHLQRLRPFGPAVRICVGNP